MAKGSGGTRSISNNAKYTMSQLLSHFDYDSFISRGSIGDDGTTVQGYFGELQGFNKKPIVVDANKFESMSKKSDTIVLYRGFRQNGDELVNNFKYGKLFEGKGAYGDGSYFTLRKSEALSYTTHNNSKHIVEAVLSKKTSKIADYDKLKSIWESDRKKYGVNSEYSWNKQDSIMTSGGGNKERLKFVNSLRVYEDFGSWATAKGYDAFYVPKEKYYVVLNRGKLIVKK